MPWAWQWRLSQSRLRVRRQRFRRPRLVQRLRPATLPSFVGVTARGFDFIHGSTYGHVSKPERNGASIEHR